MRSLLIVCLLALPFCVLKAQWTRQDSLWLQGVLEGRDTVHINPEYQQAIQDGSFINPEGVTSEPLLAEPENRYQISKDFSEYIQTEDNPHRKVPLRELPPGVFWRHWLPLTITPNMYKVIQRDLSQIQSSPKQSVTLKSGKEAREAKRKAKQAEARQAYYNSLPTPDVRSRRKEIEGSFRKDSVETP